MVDFNPLSSKMKCVKCGKEFEGTYKLCKECYDKFQASNPRDYQLIVNKDTQKEIRNKMNIGNIWNNSIKCNKCGDVIRSKNKHDFQMCKCGNCGVDGGSWYDRRIGDDYIELSEPFSDVTDSNDNTI